MRYIGGHRLETTQAAAVSTGPRPLIALTGATGFIGQHLLRELIQESQPGLFDQTVARAHAVARRTADQLRRDFEATRRRLLAEADVMVGRPTVLALLDR